MSTWYILFFRHRILVNFDYLILPDQTLNSNSKEKALFKMLYWLDQIYLLSVKVIFAHKSMTDCKFINFK